MANPTRRSKRKSAGAGRDDMEILETTEISSPDAPITNGLSRNGLPPLKRSRRSSPRSDLLQAPITRSTRSETSGEEAGENIFMRGPSRAKKAKQKKQGLEVQRPLSQESPSGPLQHLKSPAPKRIPRSRSGQSFQAKATNLLRKDAPSISTLSTSSGSVEAATSEASESAMKLSTFASARPIRNIDGSVPGTRKDQKHDQTNQGVSNQSSGPLHGISLVRRSPRLSASAGSPPSQLDKPLGWAVAVSETAGPLTIPLAPIEDTPVVRKRNKEMREARGHRRSSLGLRGRRASSLANGNIAAPHPEVQPAEFFKHLDPEMFETLRMQQLLAWCAKSALSERRARGRDVQSNARAAARVIEEEILADLTEKKVSVSWWDVSEPTNTSFVIKKPHPKNEDHERKIAELEYQLQQLDNEKRLWADIREYIPLRIQKPLPEKELKPSNLKGELLRPQDLRILPAFSESGRSVAVVRDLVSQNRSTVEFKVDQFSHGIHKAQHFSHYARNISEETLAKVSSVLDRRQEATLRAAGTKDLPLHEVLRSISHLSGVAG